jgi:hypothetical protein
MFRLEQRLFLVLRLICVTPGSYVSWQLLGSVVPSNFGWYVCSIMKGVFADRLAVLRSLRWFEFV